MAELTRHATFRMRQRNFSQKEIAYILKYARIKRKTGICFYFLGKKDIPKTDRQVPWIQRLSGSTVLVSSNKDAIITIYKNPEALRQIRRKIKRRTLRT